MAAIPLGKLKGSASHYVLLWATWHDCPKCIAMLTPFNSTPFNSEKYNIAKLPAQTVYVKTANMGHNLLTENAEWGLKTIGAFFKP